MRLFCSVSEHGERVVLAVELVAHLELRGGDFALGGAAADLDLVPVVVVLVGVGLLLVDHADGGVVVLLVAVVDRRGNLVTVLVEVDPESVILASLISAHIDLQRECLAARHAEGLQGELVAPAGDLLIVHPEEVSRWLLVFGQIDSGFERTDLVQEGRATVLERLNLISHGLHEHHQVLHGVVDGRGGRIGVDADSNLLLSAGQGGEKGEFACD